MMDRLKLNMLLKLHARHQFFYMKNKSRTERENYSVRDALILNAFYNALGNLLLPLMRDSYTTLYIYSPNILRTILIYSSQMLFIMKHTFERCLIAALLTIR